MTITLIERIICLEDGREFMLYSDIDEKGNEICQSFVEIVPEEKYAST